MLRPFMSWHRLFGLITVAGAVMVALNPALSLQASLAGLQLWFNIVLPALFPYFVLTELLQAYGVIDLLGALLERVMRSIFRLPGEGGFALAVSLMSGTPVGARVVANLRQQHACTREEAERLLAFANTSSPLFIIGAVAAGMFHWPALGLALAVAHYAGALAVGFVMRFYKMKKHPHGNKKSDTGLVRFAAASRGQHGGPSWGAVFSNAVRTAMQSQLLIGGSMMFFSVAATLMSASGITSLVATPLIYVGTMLGISEDTFPAIITGVMEVTLGLKQLADSAVPVIEQIVAASLILGWSGFSIHVQVIAMVQGTDLRYAPYVLGRAVHAVVGAITMWHLVPWLHDAPAVAASMDMLAKKMAHPAVAAVALTLLPATLLLLVLLALASSVTLARRIKGAVLGWPHGKR